MIRWQIEPMPSWSYPETKGRRPNPFRAKYEATLDLLEAGYRVTPTPADLAQFLAPMDWREQLRDVADVAGQIHVLESWMVGHGC